MRWLFEYNQKRIFYLSLILKNNRMIVFNHFSQTIVNNIHISDSSKTYNMIKEFFYNWTVNGIFTDKNIFTEYRNKFSPIWLYLDYFFLPEYDYTEYHNPYILNRYNNYFIKTIFKKYRHRYCNFQYK